VGPIAGQEVLEKRKILLPLLGFESLDRPARSLVAMAFNCIPSTGDGLDFNLGAPWFESRLSRWLSLWLSAVNPRQCQNTIPTSDDFFLPNPFQFLTDLLSHHSKILVLCGNTVGRETRRHSTSMEPYGVLLC
jgi:hypothetical protein